MLENMQVVYFENEIESIKKSIKTIEENYNSIKQSNKYYKLPKRFYWDQIVTEYINAFKDLV